MPEPNSRNPLCNDRACRAAAAGGRRAHPAGRRRPDPRPLPLALLTLLTATLTVLPALALTTLAALALTALLAERVVKQLLLMAEQVAELVHHLAETLALALVGHAAGLQAVSRVAQLAQHLLRHVPVARARHVLQVAQHLLDVLRRHELAAAIHALHRRLVLRLLGELLHELRQRLTQLLHELLDLLVRRAVLQGLRQALLGGAQGALGIGEIAVLDAQRDAPQLRRHAVARALRVPRAADASRPTAGPGNLQVLDETLGSSVSASSARATCEPSRGSSASRRR